MSGTSSDRQPPLDPMAFFRRICILRQFIAIDPRTDDPTEDRKDNPCELRFTDKKSGICYRAIARYSEAFCNSNERDMEVMKSIFFEWAVPDVVDDLNGPILGELARVDGLQGCSPGGDDLVRMRRAARDDIALIAAEKDCALTLWGYDGLGTLATLPLEVRCKVYERAFHRLSDRHFWQCYHTKRDGFSLLGISHSNPLPVIFSLSNAIRNEVLDSVYREQVAKIIIDGETVAFNFPLNAGLRPGESVDARLARVPLSKELFIGIQLPSPRNDADAAAVRSNVERVAILLSSMSHPLPPIRVSFHTNADTRGRQYYHDDFDFYMVPFRNLRLPLRDPELKHIHPLTVDRPGPNSKKRDEACNKIERAVSQALEARLSSPTVSSKFTQS